VAFTNLMIRIHITTYDEILTKRVKDGIVLSVYLGGHCISAMDIGIWISLIFTIAAWRKFIFTLGYCVN